MATGAGRTLLLLCRPRLRPLRLATDLRSAPSMSTASLSCRSAQDPSTRARDSNSRVRPAAHGADSERHHCHKHVRSTFNYSVAASYIAKGRRYDPSTHVFHFNPYNRVQPPKPGRGKSSRPESGQDAFFVSRSGVNPGGVALGLADGVGGWMDAGVDPADFSHAFCDYMAQAVYENNKTTGLTARQLMQRGYEAVCHDPTIKAGGSTAIVGLCSPDGTLEVANLGDSGFVLLRLNGVHASSEPQTHAFNTPYQLSVVPPSMLLRAAAFGGARLMDHPRDAEVTRHALRHGDVLVFASDGLWDNLFNQDILRIVSRTMTRAGAWQQQSTDAGVHVVADLEPHTRLADNVDASKETTAAAAEEEDKSPQQQQQRSRHHQQTGPATVTLQSLLAMEIVSAAKAASMNRKLDGPFSKEVKKYFPNERWHGGKEDDICVVVVVVSEETTSKAKL
ncbi:5-azacytidine resistance protein azr1 [Diplogelasinospora grovesii]|uniref:Protein phosphatase n=1 Tax=Diplogelasinospora grovesii TaxID=303347 RepID=A0AAN6S0Y4_9PEZI|nr:5-azacytidine resistance protein azr1 [Diplogelasinospora grovesii]